MIIYKCRFTGDELLSDAFKPRPVVDDEGNEVPGLIEIDSQKVNKVMTMLCSDTCMPSRLSFALTH
jgi:Translationally controlled tumour protein